MPRPTFVSAGQVPNRHGTRTKSSAQKVVDEYVTLAIPMLEEMLGNPDPGEQGGVLLAFTTEDDPGFAFTGSTATHLKDRCRRMVRSAMRELVPDAVDDRLVATYDVPVKRQSDDAFSVEGFRVFLTPK